MKPARPRSEMTNTDSDRTVPRLLLSKREAANALGMSIRKLEGLLHEPDPPPHVRFGDRMTRFPQAALEAWLTRRTVNAGGVR